MKVTIDTREDSIADIKKVIRMLQHVVGEDAPNAAPMNNFPSMPSIPSQPVPVEEQSAPVANMFESEPSEVITNAPETPQIEQESTVITAAAQSIQTITNEEPQKSDSNSTDDLFAELFSEEELSKMDVKPAVHEEEEEEIHKQPSKSPYKIEFY